ncbi:MAG: hypothetical protein QOD32_1909 [Pyrinomonadaceae bacterium]|jgi:hypothetical protein|nr:hypothetical protein [Pyrinomonadaceae bacterium]
MENKTNPEVNSAIPSGREFLSAVLNHQNVCEQKSLEHLPKLGDGAQVTLSKLGTALSLLDRLASCYWGCHGLEHIIERLVGRSVSSALAALRLIHFGHYDEALSLTRNIAETGNLMYLFFEKPEMIRKWIDSNEKDRWRNFRPAKVRETLEDLGTGVPTDSEKYGLLCEIGVHVSPSTAPQSFNTSEIPTLGGYYQERGQVICINELAWAVATVGAPAAGVAVLARDKAEEVVNAVISLADTIGEVRLDNQDAVLKFSETTESSKQLLERTKWLDKNLRQKA